MEKYEFVRSIGQGMYGQVFLAKHKEENRNYAIKRINFKDIDEKDRKNLENEVLLLKELKHPNIVSYKDSFLDKENFYNIVMIYCDGGDIYSKIKNAKNKHFSESDILDWLVQLCLALSYIHDKKILHRDLKPQNIFIQNENKIRIGDFGIAKIFNQTKEMAGSMIGTPLYMSPEQYNGKKYGFKSDIWSLGCCLFEMCNLNHAFEGNSWNAVVVKVLKGQHPPLNSMYSKEMKNLVDQMLSLNPKNRPTVASILERPVMKPKVAHYISDFIQNAKEYNAEDVQIEILKEQAEKFGIFNTKMLKEIDTEYENKTLIKDMDDLNSLNESEKKALLEQKKKIELKINELEKQRKLLLEQIKQKNITRKNNYHNLIKKSISKEKSQFNSLEKKNVIQKRSNNNTNINIINEELNHSKTKNGISSQSPKPKNRKMSENEEESYSIQNDRGSHFTTKKKRINRPLTSKKDRKKEKDDQENLSLIREETNNYIIERNKITKITQEIGKMKKYLEQTTNKINQMHNGAMNIDGNQPDNNGGNLLNNISNININETVDNDCQKENEQINEDKDNHSDKNYILDERITFFKNRCVNSLGQKLFNKAYDYLKNVNLYNNTNKNIIEPITIREHLVNLFGKNNIGFWQLIDQILLLENIKNGNSNNSNNK